MVHNGIEYGDMQLIGEAYQLMQRRLGMSPAELHEVFAPLEHGRAGQLPDRDHRATSSAFETPRPASRWST